MSKKPFYRGARISSQRPSGKERRDFFKLRLLIKSSASPIVLEYHPDALMAGPGQDLGKACSAVKIWKIYDFKKTLYVC